MPKMGMNVTQLTSGCRGRPEMDIEVIREDSQFGVRNSLGSERHVMTRTSIVGRV